MRFFLLIFFSASLFGVSFLQPDEAFIPKITQGKENTINVKIDLGDQIYLYAKSLKVEDADTADGITFSSVTNTTKTLNHEGEKIFNGAPEVLIELSKKPSVKGMQTVRVKLSYQGCSEAGLCYEPQEKILEISIDSTKIPEEKASQLSAPAVDVPAVLPLQPTTVANESKDLNTDEVVKPKSETDQIASVIEGGSIWVIVISFFGFGLLLSLTPCVFPMIPIISSVIIAQGEGIGAKKAFWLSLVYVLAMAAAYTIAGILAGLFGANLQAAFQSPWIITVFALIFVVLSLSMFDVYELQVPNFIQSRVSRFSGQKGGFIGVAIMGFLSALIVGPCVAAPLAGALIYIGQTGDALLGGIALFALSIGMGVPLLVVGTTSGRFMPKPGAWMDTIKSIFGVMMIGVAIWMLSKILDESIIMLLSGLLAVLVAINIGALEPISESQAWSMARNQKALGLVVLFYGMSLLLGGMGGAKDPLHPLEPYITHMSTASVEKSEHKAFEKIKTIEELDAILAENKGKRVMVDFYADWCTACKELEEKTFSDENVKKEMDKFVLVQVDLTANDDAAKAISAKYGIFGPPAILFFDEKGIQMSDATIIGFKEPKEFMTHLGGL